MNTKNGCIPTGPGFHGYWTYDFDQTELEFDTVDLFAANQNWVDFNVDTEEENSLSSGQDAVVDTPVPSTPYPHTAHNKDFSPDQLAYEINKLYVQEMNSEFNPTPLLSNTEKESEETAWQSPPLPKKIKPQARYTDNEHNMTYLRPAVDEDIMQVDDGEWQVRVYDELLARLTHVHDATTEKWLGHDGEDDGPYRFKVFEYFEEDFWSASSSTLSSKYDYPGLEDTHQHHVALEEKDQEEDDGDERVLL